MKHLPTLSYLPGPGSCVCLATYRATRRRLHRSSWLALVVNPARLLSGGVLFQSGLFAKITAGRVGRPPSAGIPTDGPRHALGADVTFGVRE